MEKTVGIIGAGISGLLACKYAKEKGFHPTIFEEQDNVGGLWNHTFESTKLQNSKDDFCFSDFPWPSSVKDTYPHNTQVLKYLQSYAQHFSLLNYVKFRSRVISLDYIGVSVEEMNSWEQWGGTGKAFGSKGKWIIKIQHTLGNSIKDYMVDFVIICIGRFSGLPNVPEFAKDSGPECFDGKVRHTVDFSAMDNATSAKLIKGKRVAVIGSGKSAVDLATQCANVNGTEYPCTLVVRTPHWMLPSPYIWGVPFGYLYVNRFSELLIHKPDDGFLHNALVTFLSPLRWGIAKIGESYLRWKLPMKKYKMVPPHSILQDSTSCNIMMLPNDFYDRVEEGSIIIKHSERIGFYSKGLMIDGKVDQPLETDTVILATGYRGDWKLKNIFGSSTFQDYIFGSPDSPIPLYRQIIHPRIPQLAVIGYAECRNNMHACEIQCWWLSNFLAQKFQLPSITEMEKDVFKWGEYMKRYAPKSYRTSCVGGVNIWYNDQLCKDVGSNPRRKKGFFSEMFDTYGPSDYLELLSN